MKRTVEKVFFALIRFEVNKTEIGDDIKKLITPEILPALFILAKKHDLAHLVGEALHKNGFLVNEPDLKKKFLHERNMAVYRYEQIQYEFDRICGTLESVGISFIPLKGSVICQYYHAPWMRTSCDIDIFVGANTLEEAARFLCERLGYKGEAQKTVNELSLYSVSGVHLELHYDLTEGNKYGENILSHIWDYAILKEGTRGWYLLNDPAFYFYHIAHMIKHFEYGGCGIRPFLDLWILKNKISYNQKEREEMLQCGGFLKFAKASEKLAAVWFSGQDMDELSERLHSYVITGGIYGTIQSRIGMQQSKKGGGFKYIISRIFISNNELKIKYPRVEKYPLLAPIYHMKRWLKPLAKKRCRDVSLTELTETFSIKKTTRKENAKLLKDLGL